MSISTIIAYIIFSSWMTSAKNVTANLANADNKGIFIRIDSLIDMPENMNDNNKLIFENDILDLSDEDTRDIFFAGILNSHGEDIYLFAYGTANGEYYGARRNSTGAIEIIRSDVSTGGNAWYYMTNDDLTAGDITIYAGKYDPRERTWYKAAAEAGKPTFTPIYRDFIEKDLAITAAWPVYNDKNELKGVLAADLLLSRVGDYLEGVVREHNGLAVIVEKETGNLVANSMGIDNFTVSEDYAIERTTIENIDIPSISKAFQQYKSKDNAYLVRDKLYICTEEYKKEGIDWLIISAVPESWVIAEVTQKIHVTTLIVIIAVLLLIGIYYAITKKLSKPMNNLLEVAGSIASGDFSHRATIYRNDEFGTISKAFNKMAENLSYIIDNLEKTIRKSTEDLEDSKEQLRLILDSSGEGIIGVDILGNCTFCNISCMEMLGYESQNELLGKNVHWMIHHSRLNGSAISIDECNIYQAYKKGEKVNSDDEIFWRADGSYFFVEYNSHPQIKNGGIIGAVVTFRDITERKNREEDIIYFSCHDTLTGLYNRRCFEDILLDIDTSDNLPVSLIFADINGLKMTNDVFGHAAGDELIKKTSEILLRSCREDDIVSRIGGDEFVIILLKTSSDEAAKIISRIKNDFTLSSTDAVKCSISLGSSTKTGKHQSIRDIMSNAEEAMYIDKTTNRKSVNMGMIDTIMDTLHKKSPLEKHHSISVSKLCMDFGKYLGLSRSDVNKLKRAGYLHNIGKIVLDERILSKDELAEEEIEKLQQHAVVGFRILNLVDDTMDIAEDVYFQHERWDGIGYPRGLKGEEIPLLSRIIAIVETYARVLSSRNLATEDISATVIIRDGAGTRFDPQLAEEFVRMIEGNA